MSNGLPMEGGRQGVREGRREGGGRKLKREGGRGDIKLGYTWGKSLWRDVKGC